MDDIERILEKAHALRAKKAGEGNAGVLKPRLSAGELKDKNQHCPSHTRSEITCQWGCKARLNAVMMSVVTARMTPIDKLPRNLR